MSDQLDRTTTTPKYFVPWSERVRLAREVLEIVGGTIAAKGGHAKAQKEAHALNKRNQQIRDYFAQAMKSGGIKKGVIVGHLAIKRELHKRTINKILRE